MLISNTTLIGTPILSVQDGGRIATVHDFIIDPDNLKIIAFHLIPGGANTSILPVSAIREYSKLGFIIDSAEDLVGEDDVIKIKSIISLDFHLLNLKVETKKHTNLGHVSGFTTTEDFLVQQIIVKRPLVKSFIDPELTIPRQEIVEITDDKIIVKDEEKVIRERATKEDFIPNFVNPFRSHEPGYAPTQTETPDGKDN